MSEREYRIEYTIQATDGGEEWADIGFGSSGGWNGVDPALYAIESDIQRRQWETEPGMPDPQEVDTAEAGQHG